jgi:tRNA threonylcarbamoyl adenosine modification protein YeaZ
MMRLLVIDTASEACSVGVSVEGRGPVLISETIGRGHAERLLGMVAEAMAAAGLAFAELDRIAVTVGPGSFTGVRVGIAAARGLALVVGSPVAGIGTLAVHAEKARALAGPRAVFAALDARRDEVYGQAFDADGLPLGQPEVAAPAEFAARLGPDVLLAGSGASIVAASLGGQAETRIVHRDTAADLASLIRLGLLAPPPSAPPRPLYLRPADAKPQQAAAVARR